MSLTINLFALITMAPLVNVLSPRQIVFHGHKKLPKIYYFGRARPEAYCVTRLWASVADDRTNIDKQIIEPRILVGIRSEVLNPTDGKCSRKIFI